MIVEPPPRLNPALLVLVLGAVLALAAAYAASRRLAVGRTAEAAAPAPAVAERPADLRGVTSWEWVSRPSGEDMARHYPLRAVDNEIIGQTTLRCTVSASGSLIDCAVIAESPAGEGFGRAALQLAAEFRMRPVYGEGPQVDDAEVTIPIRWNIGG